MYGKGHNFIVSNQNALAEPNSLKKKYKKTIDDLAKLAVQGH